MSKKWIRGGLVKNQNIAATHIANSAQATTTVLEANLGIPVVIELVVPDVASGNVDYTGLPYKIRVNSVQYLKTGGAGNAGNSITLHNGTGGAAITGAMNSATDEAVVIAATINDANITVPALTTLRCVTVKAGGNNAAIISIRAVRTA